MSRSGIVGLREHAGSGGRGVVIGIVDTGVDAHHPDFRRSDGRTRIAWLLDFSRKPLGLHPDLEQRFGCSDPEDAPCAVLDSADIDAALAGGDQAYVPQDVLGHGTHVASLALGDGRPSGGAFVGAAPESTLVVARVTRESSEIADADVYAGTRFVFDRAEALGGGAPTPSVVNLSLGRTYGPHDGSSWLEESLARLVGPEYPGRAIVVASGDGAAGPPGHARLQLDDAAQRFVIRSSVKGSTATSGSVFVWFMARGGHDVTLSVRGDDGLLLPATRLGDWQRGRDANERVEAELGPPPEGSVERPRSGARAASLVLTGHFKPSARYEVEASGVGVIDAWIQSEVIGPELTFEAGTHEYGIMLPASHPDLLAVGSTVAQVEWETASGQTVRPPSLSDDGSSLFSSYGPNLQGEQKPELSAPGAFVVGALSRDATPDRERSMFRFARGACSEPDCALVDEQHAVASGTSMSAAVVTGAVALLLEQLPTLTQRDITRALQGGARWPAGDVHLDSQLGVGALHALQAYFAIGKGSSFEAAPAHSWFVLSSPSLNGVAPIQGNIALRGDDGSAATLAADARLSVRLNGQPVVAERAARGLWQFQLNALDPPDSEAVLAVTLGDTPLRRATPTVVHMLEESDDTSRLGVQGGCCYSRKSAHMIDESYGVTMMMSAWLFRRRSGARVAARTARRTWSSAAVGFGALCLGACLPLSTPRLDDASAPDQYVSAAKPRERCEPEVELVRSRTEANRPYRELANLSATCYPGVPSECERQLLDRACELKASAVILTEAKSGGAPPGGTTDSRVLRSAIAVRWTPEASAP